MSWIYLSHSLNSKTPGYKGQSGFSYESTKCLSSGDTCNQQLWTINNHIGTHIDAPKHFADDGPSISDFPADFWQSQKNYKLDIELLPSGIIDLTLLVDNMPSDTEFLILKTGFEKFRSQDIYWKSSPCITSKSCEFIRKKFANLKFLGFDFLSLTSLEHRKEGTLAHQALLKTSTDSSPVLVIEDMHLDGLNSPTTNIITSPLRVSDSDGSPVTVFAELETGRKLS